LPLTCATLASRSSSACLAVVLTAPLAPLPALSSDLAALACAALAIAASLRARSVCFTRASFLWARALGAGRLRARTIRAFFLAALLTGFRPAAFAGFGLTNYYPRDPTF